ncbi:MAG: PAS domain-containing protein [Gemmataceae bacterium]
MRVSVGSLALGLVLGGALSAVAEFGLSLVRSSDLASLLADPLWWGQAFLPGALAGIVVAALSRPPRAIPASSSTEPLPIRKPHNIRRQRGSWLARRIMAATLSAEGRLLDVSPRFARRLGRSRSQLLGVLVSQLAIESDRASIEKAFADAARLGEARAAARFAVRLSAPQPGADPRRMLRLSLRRTSKSSAKQPLTFRCIFSDATAEAKLLRTKGRLERQLILAKRDTERYRQDLRGLKRSYHDLYHQAPIMYFSLDSLERLIGFNDTLVRILGTPREKLAMRPYREVLAFDSPQKDAPPFPLTAEKEEEAEAQWRRHDGVSLDVWIRSQAVYDSSGSFVR